MERRVLFELVRDGALNEILADLNRSADQAECLSRALEALRSLDGSARGPSGPAQRGGVAPGGVSESLSALHQILDRPDRKLAAYGTLVPGERNHGRVAHLGGSWHCCFVRGRRWTAADGDPRFLWNPGGPEVEAMLLISERLPAAWPELDRFEGSPYRRHLVPVRVPVRGEETHQVAYLYESAEQRVLG